MTIRSTLKLPKEHGSWGMFFIPIVLGFVAAGGIGVPGLLFLVSSTAAFLSREPGMATWRAWRRHIDPGRAGRSAFVYTAAAAGFGALLIIGFGRYWLLPVAAVTAATIGWHSERTMRGQGRSAAAELVAIAASMLGAPAAVYAVTGHWHGAWVLWGLCTAYFASSVFYVKMRVSSAHFGTKPTALAARRTCAIYHAGLFAVLALCAGLGMVHGLVPLAFVPILIRALHRVVRPTTHLNLKRIGWTEVAYSLFFVVMISLSYYAQFARSITVSGS